VIFVLKLRKTPKTEIDRCLKEASDIPVSVVGLLKRGPSTRGKGDRTIDELNA
jgi:hypothetical protein